MINHNNNVTPFRDLLAKYAKWIWTQTHSEASRNLKANFVRSVCLSHIIPGSRFKLQTDVNIIGLGGVLYQNNADGDEHIISIASRCLTSCESRYTTTELELLAIIYCVEKFRDYLIGVEFEIITDHKSLIFLNSSVYHNPRLIRWGLLLQQYNYTVSYCRGIENKVADVFSRNPDGKFHEEVKDNLMIASLHHFYSPNQNLNDISSLVIMSLYANEASLKRILKNIHNMQQKMYIVKTLRNNYSVIIRMKVIIKFTKTLFHRENNTQNWRIIIPIEIKTTIIEINHDKLGHPGVYKMLQHLKKFYFWKCMHKDVKSFILRCDLGQRTKYLTIAMEGTFQPVHV